MRRRGNGRGRHPPQERPRPSRGTGRAAARISYSAMRAVSVTPFPGSERDRLPGTGRP